MDILLSLFTGGATGLLGTALSAGLKLFERAQAQKHELKLRELDLRHLAAEAASAERIAAIEAESAETAAEWAGLQASYREAASRWTEGQTLTPAQSWLLVLVDVVRGLMRPGLTVVLIGYVGWAYHTSTLNAAQIISTILYLATACVLWWFGSRQVEKALGR